MYIGPWQELHLYKQLTEDSSALKRIGDNHERQFCRRKVVSNPTRFKTSRSDIHLPSIISENKSSSSRKWNLLQRKKGSRRKCHNFSRSLTGIDSNTKIDERTLNYSECIENESTKPINDDESKHENIKIAKHKDKDKHVVPDKRNKNNNCYSLPSFKSHKKKERKSKSSKLKFGYNSEKLCKVLRTTHQQHKSQKVKYSQCRKPQNFSKYWKWKPSESRNDIESRQIPSQIRTTSNSHANLELDKLSETSSLTQAYSERRYNNAMKFEMAIPEKDVSTTDIHNIGKYFVHNNGPGKETPDLKYEDNFESTNDCFLHDPSELISWATSLDYSEI